MNNSGNKRKYLFGPVPSRRLGLSLGVDIVPFKYCTQDCIYCQLGQASDRPSDVRKSFVPIDTVIHQLRERISEGLTADYITLSGSGEPTLNSDFGLLIDEIHSLTDIPVAVITNGTLLYQPSVRLDAGKADLVVPSLDCFDQDSFDKINRPSENITFENLITGLTEFSRQYKGKLWLEVFLIDGINTSDDQLYKIRDLIKKIAPDKVQLNTAVRPTAEKGLLPVSRDVLERAAQIIGPLAEIIVDCNKLSKTASNSQNLEQAIFETLKRRPCSIEDISIALGVHRNEVLKYITSLLMQKKITSDIVGDIEYYKTLID